MNKEELEKEVQEKYSSQLSAIGIRDVHLSDRNSIPSESELKSKGAWLRRLGVIRKNAIWIIIAGYTVLEIFSLVANFPQDIEAFKINYPDTYDAVIECSEYVRDISHKLTEYVSDSIEPTNPPTFLVFDQKWEDDPYLYSRDVASLSVNKLPQADDRTIELFPLSGVPPEIITRTTFSSSSSSSPQKDTDNA